MNNDPALPDVIFSTKPKTREETNTRRVPPYNLILENDDHHSFEFVMGVLIKALGYTVERSFELTQQAHFQGRAVVWTGPKEVAELKHDQVMTFHETRESDGRKLGPVGCVIEPARVTNPIPDGRGKARTAPLGGSFMAIEPLAIGVCSWSLQVKSIQELKLLLDELGIDVVQIACGDPHHAAWEEGDRLPEVARAAGFNLTGAMLGFPGEDYTTPQTIQKSGGFGDPETRPERLERFQWALDRTRALGLADLMLHAGFLPEPDAPDRKPFLDTLAKAADLAKSKGITLAFETGQETADLLRRTLDELKCPNVKVNFDPANMLLYDKGDPIRAVEILGPDIRSVHVKDANRPATPGQWGEEVPLGRGQANIRQFVKSLQKVGYRGPLCIEREVGNQRQRVGDIAHGIRFLRECLAT